MSIGDALRSGGTGVRRSANTDVERAAMRSYAWMRLVVGGIGALLPTVLLVGDAFFLDAPFKARDSISAYYHTSMRDWFVGTLCVIGVMLITYMLGEWRQGKGEFWISTIAGLGLLGVAFFPTERSGVPASGPHCGDAGVLMPPGCTDLEQRLGEVRVGDVHLTCAAVALTCLGLLAYRFGRRDWARALPGHRRLAILEFVCAGVIGAALLLALAGWAFTFRVGSLTPLYLGEVVTVYAFAVSWIAQGVDLWRWRGASGSAPS